MQENRDRLVIKDSYKTRWIFGKKRHLEKTTLIYSMWEGCLADVKQFWEDNNVPILQVHCSGHAYIEDLQKFVGVIKPKFTIPVHTFFPEKYPELLGSNVMRVKDGDVMEI